MRYTWRCGSGRMPCGDGDTAFGERKMRGRGRGRGVVYMVLSAVAQLLPLRICTGRACCVALACACTGACTGACACPARRWRHTCRGGGGGRSRGGGRGRGRGGWVCVWMVSRFSSSADDLAIIYNAMHIPCLNTHTHTQTGDR